MKATTFIFSCILGLLVTSCIADGSALARNVRSTLTEEAEKVVSQGSSIDVNNINNVGALIELVEKNGADNCLARVICELTQNGRAHGEAGVKFGQSLLKFRQSKHSKVKKYTDAMNTGAKAKSADKCKSDYSACSHSTQEVITVGNKIFARPAAAARA